MNDFFIYPLFKKIWFWTSNDLFSFLQRIKRWAKWQGDTRTSKKPSLNQQVLSIDPIGPRNLTDSAQPIREEIRGVPNWNKNKKFPRQFQFTSQFIHASYRFNKTVKTWHSRWNFWYLKSRKSIWMVENYHIVVVE